MVNVAIIQAVSVLAPLLQRAVEGHLSAKALAELQALSEREFGDAVEDWKASKPGEPDQEAELGGGTRFADLGPQSKRPRHPGVDSQRGGGTR
jgi:hypothetical protein